MVYVKQTNPPTPLKKKRKTQNNKQPKQNKNQKPLKSKRQLLRDQTISKV